MHEGIAAGDAGVIRSIAHGLKSSSANLGALRLADICREMEASGRDNTLARTGELLKEIEEEYAVVRVALADNRPGRYVMIRNLPGEKPPVVLVVDDDVTVRLLARESMEQAGFTVQEAEDGTLALAAYELFRPDVVLLDVMLPGKDGFTVCAEIREFPGGDDTQILMMTGLMTSSRSSGHMKWGVPTS